MSVGATVVGSCGGVGVAVSNGTIVVAGGVMVGVAVSGRSVSGADVMVAVGCGDISTAGLQANNKTITNPNIPSDLIVVMSISKGKWAPTIRSHKALGSFQCLLQ